MLPSPVGASASRSVLQEIVEDAQEEPTVRDSRFSDAVDDRDPA